MNLPDAEVDYLPGVFEPSLADELFQVLRQDVAWQQEEILMFGQRRRVPRLVAWYGDPGAEYGYSGVLHQPRPWIPAQAALAR